MVSSFNIGSLRSTSPSSSKRTFKSNGLAIAVEKEWTRKEWTTAKSGKMNRFRWKGEHQLNRKGDGPSARPHDSALAAEKMIQKRAMQRKRRAMLRRRARAKCERARPKRGHASERMQTAETRARERAHANDPASAQCHASHAKWPRTKKGACGGIRNVDHSFSPPRASH